MSKISFAALPRVPNSLTHSFVNSLSWALCPWAISLAQKLLNRHLSQLDNQSYIVNRPIVNDFIPRNPQTPRSTSQRPLH